LNEEKILRTLLRIGLSYLPHWSMIVPAKTARPRRHQYNCDCVVGIEAYQKQILPFY
jgi:hypothetical protein